MPFAVQMAATNFSDTVSYNRAVTSGVIFKLNSSMNGGGDAA